MLRIISIASVGFKHKLLVFSGALAVIVLSYRLLRPMRQQGLIHHSHPVVFAPKATPSEQMQNQTTFFQNSTTILPEINSRGKNESRLPVTDSPVNHRSQPTWKPISRYTYAYSAFYDDRKTPHSIRVIIVLDEELSVRDKRCAIHLSDEMTIFVRGQFDPIGFGVRVNNTRYKEFILTCPVPQGVSPPVSVSLGSAAPRVEVVFPTTLHHELGLCTCVSVTFQEPDWQRMVEWLEMQRILGVSQVFIYNNSIPAGSKAATVLAYYQRQGFLVLKHSEPFLRTDVTKEGGVLLHMSPVINDCMYRNMHRCQYIMVIDLDEVIVPRQHNDLISMLVQLSLHEHKTQHNFRNVYYFLNSSSNEPAESVFLRENFRLETSPPLMSVKSIINPLTCTHMHNHRCWSGWDMQPELDVAPEIATNNHYKACHFDGLLRRPGICSWLAEQGFPDDTMQRFAGRLLPAICRAKKDIFQTT
ncbi:hypothetical protein CAPTEDRAFT_208702 [Capitella teleta]|uniref:Glycosyltransferase family 92 protein n=1 Tax=Capitella teleta TaxID=283909 RepID=R7TNI9_CAPTE|nr:hypothetical protein CAPTEDRAFT_208702 [Capitella teleta]|eukprot:ELT95423.1 hypothetical protein CAPTEDRAFT_208702 [Capitella teleta]